VFFHPDPAIFPKIELEAVPSHGSIVSEPTEASETEDERTAHTRCAEDLGVYRDAAPPEGSITTAIDGLDRAADDWLCQPFLAPAGRG
jgi:hypothetical protein